MTSSSSSLTNIDDYKGNLRIQTANGENLPITYIGDVISPLPLKDVFVSPRLTTNLVYHSLPLIVLCMTKSRGQ